MNAAKYTCPGGHITIRTEEDGGEIVVRVRDSGIVDDNVDSAEMLAAALSAKAYETRVAHDPPVAMRIAVQLQQLLALPKTCRDVTLALLRASPMGNRGCQQQ